MTTLRRIYRVWWNRYRWTTAFIAGVLIAVGIYSLIGYGIWRWIRDS